MNKQKHEVFASIDVGSNSIRMIISEISSNGKIKTLEDLYQPTRIGKDTFANGRIQVQSIRDTCDVLKGFHKLMREYGVKNYKAVSTSGIREAQNMENVLEQIRIRSGLKVEVINNSQERFYMFKAIKRHLSEKLDLVEKDTFIVYICSGGVEVSVYSKGVFKFTEYVRIGSLRLREMLSQLEKQTIDFPYLMEEFVESRVDFIKHLINKLKITNFIGLGGELRNIAAICKGENIFNKGVNIDKGEFKAFYSTIRKMTTSQIIDEYKIPRNNAEILLPAAILFDQFLDMTDSKGIYAPMISLRHGVLYDMIDERMDTPQRVQAFDDIVSSVWYISEKYSLDRVHGSYIEKISLAIFDQMTKIHKLGESERLYLRVASILHDMGKYISSVRHEYHSFNIIKYQDIMGLSTQELNLVANVVRYHSEEIPLLTHENFLMLPPEDKIVVSKLTAILKVAEALDISHKQKIKKLDISITDTEAVFKLHSNEDLLLEEWSFYAHEAFFEEVMGLKPIIKRKRMV